MPMNTQLSSRSSGLFFFPSADHRGGGSRRLDAHSLDGQAGHSLAPAHSHYYSSTHNYRIHYSTHASHTSGRGRVGLLICESVERACERGRERSGGLLHQRSAHRCWPNTLWHWPVGKAAHASLAVCRGMIMRVILSRLLRCRHTT